MEYLTKNDYDILASLLELDGDLYNKILIYNDAEEVVFLGTEENLIELAEYDEELIAILSILGVGEEKEFYTDYDEYLICRIDYNKIL